MLLATDFRRQARVCARLAEECEDRRLAERHPRAVISPGPVRTGFQAASQSSPELVKQFIADVPMQRFGEPEEIGELVLFICSDACEFMTADTVYANGGSGRR